MLQPWHKVGIILLISNDASPLKKGWQKFQSCTGYSWNIEFFAFYKESSGPFIIESFLIQSSIIEILSRGVPIEYKMLVFTIILYVN